MGFHPPPRPRGRPPSSNTTQQSSEGSHVLGCWMFSTGALPIQWYIFTSDAIPTFQPWISADADVNEISANTDDTKFYYLFCGAEWLARLHQMILLVFWLISDWYPRPISDRDIPSFYTLTGGSCNPQSQVRLSVQSTQMEEELCETWQLVTSEISNTDTEVMNWTHRYPTCTIPLTSPSHYHRLSK